jgi:hypothetical protein
VCLFHVLEHLESPAAYAERLRGLRSPPAPSAPAGTPAPVGAGLARDGLS